MSQSADLRERNLRAVFNILDIDGDGIISSNDFMTMAGLRCDLIGVTDDARRAALNEAYQSWWEQLRADADQDGDGRVTQTEFAATLASGRGDPAAYYRQGAGPVLKVMTEAMDHDGDGFIEHEEFLLVAGLAGENRQAYLDTFSRLDSDGDGRLTPAQFQESFEHLFLSQDPADPGTAMLGHA